MLRLRIMERNGTSVAAARVAEEGHYCVKPLPVQVEPLAEVGVVEVRTKQEDKR
jgi:hypothetical protein